MMKMMVVVEESPRKKGSRPTLLDLLSVPGPLRSPSPPAAASSHALVAVTEKQENEQTVEVNAQLPTPELTPAEDVHRVLVAPSSAPTSPTEDVDVDIETLVSLLVTHAIDNADMF